MRAPTASNFGIIAIVALAALAAEFCVGFVLGFSPGWANGWPGGLSIYRVWSASMTTVIFAIEMTVGIGSGAMISLLLSRFPKGRRQAWLIFAAWLMGCTALATLNCSWLYHEIYFFDIRDVAQRLWALISES
jgi:hypothetical protein